MSSTSGLIAQIFNLLYRRVLLGRASDGSDALEWSHVPQITTQRYSRLKICAAIRRSPALMAAQAFTFVELLVVLAVVTVLAATLLPAMAKSRPNAQAYQCLNNHRQLCAAWRMYADDSRERIVYASGDGTSSKALASS